MTENSKTRNWKDNKITELEKIIAEKDKAQDLSAAIIQEYKKELASLQSKAASDSNLIESLNRYIKMLETKINHQNGLLHDPKKPINDGAKGDLCGL